MRLRAQVFRADDPRWSFAPLSGGGARRFGGRFNPVGMPALYTSLTVEGAWREAQQAFQFKPQPLTICAYEVECDYVADLTDDAARASLGVAAGDLACGWKEPAARGLTPPSWALARRLHTAGVAAIIVPNFAVGALAGERNIVFWRWGEAPPHQVCVVDDEGRLPRYAASWRSGQADTGVANPSRSAG